MLDPVAVLNIFNENNISFFAGVPDSLLKELNQALLNEVDPDNHLITVNEGTAVSFGIGYHIATNKTPLIYMQNSGLGNAINPLTSLADPEVYSIPMLLLIGWRGEPGIKDEPQHIKQGRITPTLLECLEIPYKILPKGLDNANSVISNMIQIANNENCPTALLAVSYTHLTLPTKA